jgi:hypothetical protein
MSKQYNQQCFIFLTLISVLLYIVVVQVSVFLSLEISPHNDKLFTNLSTRGSVDWIYLDEHVRSHKTPEAQYLLTRFTQNPTSPRHDYGRSSLIMHH